MVKHGAYVTIYKISRSGCWAIDRSLRTIHGYEPFPENGVLAWLLEGGRQHDGMHQKVIARSLDSCVVDLL